MPRPTFVMSSFTPITPVDATSTLSRLAADARRPSAAPSPRACSMPSSPVQALAQPLLTTMAAASPARRAVIARHDHRRGLREVRREDRGRRRRRGFARDDREVEPASGLDAARDARGAEARRRRDAAVDRVETSRIASHAGIRLQPLDVGAASGDAASAVDDGRGLRGPNRGAVAQRQRHRVLAARAEQRARRQSRSIFSGHPHVRHDREARDARSATVVREGAQRREAASRSPLGARCATSRGPICWPRERSSRPASGPPPPPR